VIHLQLMEVIESLGAQAEALAALKASMPRRRFAREALPSTFAANQVLFGLEIGTLQIVFTSTTTAAGSWRMSRTVAEEKPVVFDVVSQGASSATSLVALHSADAPISASLQAIISATFSSVRTRMYFSGIVYYDDFSEIYYLRGGSGGGYIWLYAEQIMQSDFN
jgi:hypothetical protein